MPGQKLYLEKLPPGIKYPDEDPYFEAHGSIFLTMTLSKVEWGQGEISGRDGDRKRAPTSGIPEFDMLGGNVPVAYVH